MRRLNWFGDNPSTRPVILGLTSYKCRILFSYNCRNMSLRFRIKVAKKAKDPPRISDAEWVVMKAVWRTQVATANQVVERLAGQTSWKPKTIHTLLRRLVQKGVLSSQKSGREYLFQAIVTEAQCRLSASQSFLEKVFDGEVAPFLACFLKGEKLSRKEIDELKRLLEEEKP